MARSWRGHSEPSGIPEGVWMRCDGCAATLFRKEVERNLNVCPQCQHHFPLAVVPVGVRFLDDGQVEVRQGVSPSDASLKRRQFKLLTRRLRRRPAAI